MNKHYSCEKTNIVTFKILVSNKNYKMFKNAISLSRILTQPWYGKSREMIFSDHFSPLLMSLSQTHKNITMPIFAITRGASKTRLASKVVKGD